MKEIINLTKDGQSSDSTGVSEGDEITIMMKRIVSEDTAIAITESPEHTEKAKGSQGAHESQWKSMKTLEGGGNSAGEQSNDKDVHSLTHLFFKLISTRNKNSQAKDEETTSEQESESSVVEQESESSVVEQESEEKNESSDTFLDSKSPLDEKSKNETEAKPSESEKKDQDIEKAFNQLTSILQSDSTEKLEELLKGLELIMVNMMDIGGQPALLEMLPPLTIGPALYLLFFRLDQELNKSYEVKFLAPGSKQEISIGGQYCIKGVMHQSLSSIACFGCYSQKEEMSSKILLCGTYKDKAEKKKVDTSSMEKELRKELKDTKFSTEGLLLDASHTDLFFSVDNRDGDENEMSPIRTSIEKCIMDHFVPIKVPAVWLMLRVVLHIMKKPIVTLSQCKEIYRRLSNQEKESARVENSVKAALRFFHHNVGNLMYYEKIDSMQDTVICDPQVIMDSVSSLIFDRFTGVNLSRDLDGFKKGQFTLGQIKNAMKEKRSNLLDVCQLIDLLKDRNILAEIKEINRENEHADEQRKQADEQGRKEAHEIASDEQRRKQANRKFIMPAVLPIASNKELDWLKNASDEDLEISEQKYHKEPIMIHFSCGFVPFGIFSACMAYLIEHKNEKLLQWKLRSNDVDVVYVWRNKVTFCVNKMKDSTTFFVTFSSRPQHFEIQVSAYETVRKEFQYICPSVQQDIFNALKTLTCNWKYVPYSMSEKPLFSGPLFHLAFRCSVAKSHREHLMKFEGSTNSDGELECTCLQNGGVSTLSEEHLVWFEKVSWGWYY
jgi:hypothetical protein